MNELEIYNTDLIMKELEIDDVEVQEVKKVRIDPISEAIGIETAFDLRTGNIIDVNSNEVVVAKKELYTNNDFVDDKIDGFEKDEYELVVVDDNDGVREMENERYVKDNYKMLIDKSMDAVDELLEIARMTEKPSAYEQASNFLRAVADINEKLMAIDERKEKNRLTINRNKNVGSGDVINNTQNNIVVQSDPADILKALGNNR